MAVTQVRAAVARTLAGWPRLASMTKGGCSEWMGWIRGGGAGGIKVSLTLGVDGNGEGWPAGGGRSGEKRQAAGWPYRASGSTGETSAVEGQSRCSGIEQKKGARSTLGGLSVSKEVASGAGGVWVWARSAL